MKRKKLESKIQKREKEDLNFDENHISKKVRIETIKNKMENLSREKNLAIAFDLGWSESMNKKEISKLANQLARIHGANKKDENSAKIYFTNFKKTSDLYQECVRKHAGFEQFPIELRIVSFENFLKKILWFSETLKREESHIDMFPNDDLIILSPDSETILEKVELGKVYVIGGIVDETRKNKLTLEVAEKYKLKSVRLPIKEHLERNPDSRNGSLCTILSSNQVFEILLAQFKASFSKFKSGVFCSEISGTIKC